MTPLSTAVGASPLAHGLHAVMVLAGLWGLAALLLPHVLTRLAGAPTSYDEHAERVAALRAAVGSGALSLATRPVLARASAPAPTPRSGPVSLPLAVVAAATAAGIHAAVTPPHLRAEPLAGLFFVLAAAQVGWAARAAVRPTSGLLRAGLVLHLGLVTVWLATRTVGLPLGLLPDVHPVGPWDLTCVAWQLLAAAACARTLRAGVPRLCPAWLDWHPSSRAAAGAAACSLVLLTLVGASS